MSLDEISQRYADWQKRMRRWAVAVAPDGSAFIDCRRTVETSTAERMMGHSDRKQIDNFLQLEAWDEASGRVISNPNFRFYIRNYGFSTQRVLQLPAIKSMLPELNK